MYNCLQLQMPREDKEQEEEQKARTAYDLLRMRLERLQKNIVTITFLRKILHKKL